jgi:hypothetical protein
MIFNLSEDLPEELNQITGQYFGLPNKCGSYRVARGGSASVQPRVDVFPFAIKLYLIMAFTSAFVSPSKGYCCPRSCET